MQMDVQEYNSILYPDLIAKIAGHQQKVLTEVKLTRQVAWAAYIAPHTNPKKLPKTIHEFWPVDEEETKGNKKKISDEKRQAIKDFLKNGKT